MKTHAQENSISCITFNLGYLPGGDHAKATKGDTSIEALTQGLSHSQKRRPDLTLYFTAAAIPDLRSGTRYLHGLL